MKFCEKLQTLRKEKKLSQEQLAEMLDVSRQAVSKWESGQSYPEMDKLLSLCKIFKVSLEELTNEDIKELNVDSKSKNVITSMIDQVVNFINRTFKMATSVSTKTIGKCIIETLILIFILSICKSPFTYVSHLLDNVIKYLPDTIYHILSSSFYLVLMVVYFALVFIILFYYFDKRWLQRYENNELDVYENENVEIEEQEIQKEPKKQEKVVIRKQSSLNKIFTVLGELIVFGIKVFAFFMIIPFCFLLVFACIGICINVLAILKGVFYFGPFICIVFGIALISIILEIFFNFIFNRKTNFNRLFITFIIGLVGVGIGAGIFTIEIFNTKLTNEPIVLEQIVEKKEYKMNDKLYFVVNNNNKVEYQIDENVKDKVIFEITYNKDFINTSIELDNDMIYINSYFKSFNTNSTFNIILDDLKDKTLHDYSNLHNSNIKVISSGSNIEKLKKNYYEHTSGRSIDTECENYEYENNSLNDQINSLNNKISENNNLIETQKEKISNLESRLEEYKKTLKGLLGE